MRLAALNPGKLSLLQQRSHRVVKVKVAQLQTAAVPSSTTSKMDAAAKERARAAILGAFVADAATMPLHWIYDVPKMQELLAAKNMSEAAPEFFPEPSCPFYKAEFGNQSPYGAELVPLLKSMAQEGRFDTAKYGEAIHAYFTSCDAYRNASIRNFLELWEQGKRGAECGHPKDFQANCFAKAALLVARYAGSPELRPMVEAAVRVQQNNDEAVKYGVAGALILEQVVLGHSLEEALAWAVKEGSVPADLQQLVQRALDTRTKPLTELTYEPVQYMQEMVGKHMALKDSLDPFTLAVWCNGPACGNPAAFTNVAMTAAQLGGGGYKEAVRRNLMAGGDNCSRSCLVGALFAAQDGLSAIPEEWQAKTAGYREYEQLVDKLLAA